MAKIIDDLKKLFQQSKRVWQVTRKPTPTEFKTVAKVSAIGILVIGLIGFIIQVIWHAIGIIK